MSYILYINGNEIELAENKPIAQTKQVNNLARLDNRQSNFTNRFLAPFTAKNIRAMQKVFLTGNRSNIPYQKNVADLYDADSGECMIYKGWATIIQSTSDKGYEIYVYDGLIDLYRRIENKTLTEMGIAGLNHAKNLDNIIESWNNTLPYIYPCADYNGKNTFIGAGDVSVSINTDYQVPAARVSYIWDRLFAYADMTYTGTFFGTEEFKNLFMTFPKPVPTLVPHRELIHAGTCFPKHSTYWYYEDGGAYLSAEAYLLTLPRENFTTAYASVTNMDELVPITAGGAVYASNYINIILPGIYAIDAYTSAGFNYFRKDSTDAIVESGVVQMDPYGNFKSFLFNCAAGDKIAFIINASEAEVEGLTFEWELNRIDGYEANFEEALFNFKATTFVNEVMQHAGLTAFKDKYRNHIDFVSLDELLESTDQIDWSDKFVKKNNEVYKIGKYAKKNNFKYRYNSENETHNDGAIFINDENLLDEDTVIQSSIYSPENGTSILATRPVNVFKIWDKNVKEDGTLEYKELEGRFYFLRYKLVAVDTRIGSEILSDYQTVSTIAVASYAGLKWQNLIQKNYPAIQSILDKAKILEVYFNLKTRDVGRFDFKKLVFVEQLASYYLVNKIANFIKGKATKCELIEVDYRKRLPAIIEPVIGVGEIGIVGCEITLSIESNIPQPFTAQIIPYALMATPTGDMEWQPFDLIESVSGTVDSNQITFIADFLPYNYFGYKFLIRYTSEDFVQTDSPLSAPVIVPEECLVGYELPSVLTVDDFIFEGTEFEFPFEYRKYKLLYSYDELPPELAIYTLRVWNYSSFFGWLYDDIEKFAGSTGGLTGIDGEAYVKYTAIPTKIKIQILDKVSDEYIIP